MSSCYDECWDTKGDEKKSDDDGVPGLWFGVGDAWARWRVPFLSFCPFSYM